MFYLIKTPWWLKKMYGKRTWEQPRGPEKALYLSFDDGPHPVITNFVLDELKKYGAKASFFCIGKNVAAHPETYRRILDEGHATGNHTWNHLNGWKNDDSAYLADVARAQELIHSPLFRPPYGRLTRSQERKIMAAPYKLIPIMWTVLSGDFDLSVTPEDCLSNVLRHAGNGSIIVFHDSEKAEEKIRYVLPLILAHFSSAGYVFRRIEVV